MADTTTLKKLHTELAAQCRSKIEAAELASSVVDLTQSLFDNGTYIIDTPGVYRLAEDIEFNPNSLAQRQLENPIYTPWDSNDPLTTQFKSEGGAYDDKAYGLGFFAAIAIQCDGVVLDLNGFTLKQSVEHALQQAFFALIELADQPFVSPLGPHDFGSRTVPATNVSIINGILGKNSHHCIHGNINKRVYIENVIMEDFTVAGMALNGCKDVVVVDCTIRRNSKNIPALGVYSGGRFLRKFLNKLVDDGYTGTLTVNGVNKNATTVRDELRSSMNEVFDDIVTNGKATVDKAAHFASWQLFSNPTGIIDGTCYGLLFNPAGVAVLGFPNKRTTQKAHNIYIKNVTVSEISNSVREVLALPSTPTPTNTAYSQGGIQNDSVGALFNTQTRDGDGDFININGSNQYTGDVVSNAQAFVAKALIGGFNFGTLDNTRNSITQDTIDWVEGTKTLEQVVPNLEYVCNGDQMFHVNKGLVGIRLDGCKNIYMNECAGFGFSAEGAMGSDLCPEPYKDRIGISHPKATYYGYGGCDCRGMSICSSEDITIRKFSMSDVVSWYGPSYGIDIHQDAYNIVFEDIEVDDVKAGTKATMDRYRGNPTRLPVAVGIRIQEHAENVNFVTAPRFNGVFTSPLEAKKMTVDTNQFYRI